MFKSRYFVAGVCVLLAGVVSYLATIENAKPAKYYMVERETAVRPARFEDLKYHLEPSVDVRAPASVEH